MDQEAENGGGSEEAENGTMKLSPSPTRSPVPEQTKPASSPPPHVPSWLILDRIVHWSNRRRCGASALAHDIFGRPVRASLRIAAPPAVSRLYIHLKGWPPAVKHFQEPKAIAAHRGAILFRLTVPFEDSRWWHDTASFPDDYFVYSCRRSSSSSTTSSSSPSPPSLTRLPTCFHGGTTCPELDRLYQPHRRQQQRAMFEEEIGILSHGNEGEFTVAQLNFSGPDEFELCVLHHHPPHSMEWSVNKAKNPPNMKISAYSWWTDIVVPIGRRLCWVDNYHGMLLVDVHVITDGKSYPDHQQWFRYIPLPCEAMSRRVYRDGGSLDPLRRVSVTDAGIVKLICILTKRLSCPHPFTIKTWTLDDIDQGRWTMDVNATMGAEEFFRVLGDDGRSCCLPRVQPSFPLVSLVDPDVVCFLLKDKDSGLFWMIEVNMRKKHLQSSALYISEEEEEGYPPKRECRNRFSGHQFIPSKFSSYLSEDAITSWERFSETLQKAKQGTVMQKSGLERQFNE